LAAEASIRGWQQKLAAQGIRTIYQHKSSEVSEILEVKGKKEKEKNQ
jgi:hypothetical protein